MTRQIMIGALVGFILTAGGLWLLGHAPAGDEPLDAGAPPLRERKRPDPALMMELRNRAVQPLRLPVALQKDGGA
jgi:hypothetical protein